MNIYILPIVYLTVIYGRLMYFIRHQTPQLSQTRQGRRAQRDFVVTRRILFTVNALTLPGLPNVAFAFMVNIDHHLSSAYYMYRIEWMGPAITLFIFSIALIFISPQIKDIFVNLIRPRNHIVPATITIQNLQQPSVLLTTRVLA